MRRNSCTVAKPSICPVQLLCGFHLSATGVYQACRRSLCSLGEEETDEGHSECKCKAITKALYLHRLLVPLPQRRPHQRHSQPSKDRTDDHTEPGNSRGMNQRMRKEKEAQSACDSA